MKEEDGSFHDRPNTRSGILQHPRFIFGYLFLVRSYGTVCDPVWSVEKSEMKRTKGGGTYKALSSVSCFSSHPHRQGEVACHVSSVSTMLG
jgi:hypothetical protein